MRRRSWFWVAPTLALVALACSDRQPSEPRPPSLRSDAATYPPCAPALATLISGEIQAAFNGTVRQTASSLFGDVKKACGTPNATPKMLTYVKYLTSHLADVLISPAAPFDSGHVNHLFEYVGQPHPHLSSLAFTGVGAVTVCGSASTTPCSLVTSDRLAGLVVGVGAVTGDYLWAIAPIASSVCISANLSFQPPCYDFSVNPVTTFSGPNWVTVAICQRETGDALVDAPIFRARLAHPSPTDPTQPKLTPKVSDPFHLEQCPTSVARRDRAPSILERFGASLAALLTPTPAFARHGGAAGLAGSFSPFGAVDSAVFLGTFTADVVGQPPSTNADSSRGTWTTVVTPPGSILVQSALGDLTDKPVVLQQAGGACAQCGPLELRGTLFQSSPDQVARSGTYVVSWKALQSKPTVKAAPFRLRANGPTGPIIAELSFKSAMSGSKLYYNGTLISGVPWVQNVAQRFEVTIDFDVRTGHPAPTTRLRIFRAIDNVLQYTGSDVPFFNTAATNLVQFAAEFSGIDAGIMGMDDVFIGRRADSLTP